MEVSRRTGVAKSLIYRMHHSVGGVYRPVSASYDPRYLNREERYEIARLDGLAWSLRKIGAALGRAPSTIMRELDRNRDPRNGHYAPERAHQLAWQRQRRPKPTVWQQNPRLREQTQEWLDRRFSPDQISGRLRLEFPEDGTMRVSHETIYQGIYLYPRGALKKELEAHLRSRRDARIRRGRRPRGGAIANAVSIHDRPEEVEDRLVPGHHEGDLIKGTIASNSAVGTIVERSTGYLTLLHLPDGYRADQVATAVTAQLTALPAWFAKTLTWDRGSEMARHAEIAAATGINVYFADPHSPWQRGSNENINGLLREYLPKGTDLNDAGADDLAWIADQLNDRPRKRLLYRTPRETFATLLTEELERVASTT
jgi:IS30 family transposase